MTRWHEKPVGDVPVVGNILTALDPRFEHYTPAAMVRLAGEVGIHGLAERATDQLKFHRINKMLEGFAEQKPDVFFLQIGAYDGKTNDHLYRHIATNDHWRGLVVEPIASSYNQLQQTYAGRPNVRTARRAVHESPGERTMYHVDEQTNAEERMMLLSTFDKDLLLSKGWMADDDVGGNIVEEAVPCSTLPDLLEEYGVDEIDILEVDAEGMDALVLRQFETERFRPSFIMFEHDNMSIADLEHSLGRLRAAGYSFLSMSVDTFCYQTA